MSLRKIFVLFLVFCFWFNLTYAISSSSESMTYRDLLSLYYWSLSAHYEKNWDNVELKYLNLQKSDPLYKVLQKAVANDKFPNLEISLPLNSIATEWDLALLIKNNFWVDIEFTKWKKLSFDFLKTQLSTVYKQSLIKKEENQKLVIVNDIPEEEIQDAIYTLLKDNYLNQDKISDINSSGYSNIGDYFNQLWDDYTEYYSPKDGEAFMNDLNSSFVWIWIYVTQISWTYPLISWIIKWWPAEGAWLLPWDFLIEVDWKKFEDYKSSDAFVAAIQWKEWTTVNIKIRRWKKILSYSIKREVIKIPMIVSKNQWWKCYIRLYSFDIWIKKEFDKHLSELWNCNTYLFDVRSNPGGVVDEVVDILDEFVPKRKAILTVNSLDWTEYRVSHNAPTITLGKVTPIFVDSNTASAAEIFAWVLRYYFPDTVQLVGEKTYGKWSIQEVVEFPDHSVMKYTIATWNIANEEETIDKKWLEPDVELVDNLSTKVDEVLEKYGISI